MSTRSFSLNTTLREAFHGMRSPIVQLYTGQEGVGCLPSISLGSISTVEPLALYGHSRPGMHSGQINSLCTINNPSTKLGHLMIGVNIHKDADRGSTLAV